MPIRKGEKFKLQIPVDGELKTIGEITSCTFTQEELDNLPDVTISGTIDFEPIFWDETWLVAYQARMYAEYFRS